MKALTLPYLLPVVTGLALTTTAHATTRYLPASSSDQTAQFQSLVNASANGDVVEVQSGNHYLSGTVVVNNSGITILGDSGNTIRKSGNVSCLDLDGQSITVNGIYIDGGALNEPCMRVFGSYENILNSTFRNSGNHEGILINGSHNDNVQGCFCYYNYTCGITQWNSSDNTIQWCQLYQNGAEGITCDGGSHNTQIHDNWIHQNNVPLRGVGGIGIDASNGVQIHNNTIDYSGAYGVKFQNNLCCGDDGEQIYNNANISYNQWCAVGFRTTYPITNFGWWGNTCTGNPNGILCWNVN